MSSLSSPLSSNDNNDKVIASWTLRLTVNGGLEDFCREEIESFFSVNDDALLPTQLYLEKGNSGSRFYLTGLPLSLLQSLLLSLRYVDYVSILLGTTSITTTTTTTTTTTIDESDASSTTPPDQFLKAISEATTSMVSTFFQSEFLSIYGEIQHQFHKFSVGLEPLPAERVFATPIMDPTSEPISAASALAPCQPFLVNTIYTKPNVAKVVVETVQQLVHECDSDATTTNAIWIDAGCGNGSLLQFLPPNQRIGIDIDPPIQDDCTEQLSKDIHRADFLKDVTRQWIQQRITKLPEHHFHTIVITNPPFAVDSRGNYRPIADFIKHSVVVLKATIVAVIVPTRFARRPVLESYGLFLRGGTNSSNRNKNQASVNNNLFVRLLARMALPDKAFYDPSTNQSKHIPATLLIFGNLFTTTHDTDSLLRPEKRLRQQSLTPTIPTIRVEANRNKKHFPNIRTQKVEHTVQTAVSTCLLSQQEPSTGKIAGKDTHLLNTNTTLKMDLTAELSMSPLVVDTTGSANGPSLFSVPSTNIIVDSDPNRCCFHLFLVLNPKRPLSLINSNIGQNQQHERDSTGIIIDPPHSLGWVATSCKPNVAVAMTRCVLKDYGMDSSRSKDFNSINHANDVLPSTPKIVVNAMCGEGTLELEANIPRVNHLTTHFWLSGDKSRESLLDTKSRVNSLDRHFRCGNQCSSVLFDFVQWDCQQLPLRPGILDAFLADLPIAGASGKKPCSKMHQAPTATLNNTEIASRLDYRCVVRQALRVLAVGTGHAVFVSTDTNTLRYSVTPYNSFWHPIIQQQLSLGGLPGQFMWLRRKPATTKDVSIWIKSSFLSEDFTTLDFSQQIWSLAKKACSGYYLDSRTWELRHLSNQHCVDNNVVTNVQLMDVYISHDNPSSNDETADVSRTSHCYRITFDSRVSNHQGKALEKVIRKALQQDDDDEFCSFVDGLR